MRTLTLGMACAAAAAALTAFAAPQTEKVVVEAKSVVALKDGGSIVFQKDGVTYHADASGKRVRMKDGVVMEGADGQKYLMKNDVIWKQVTEKGTLAPNR